ncbi:MAG: ApeP family dehydratase [Marinicella sp.]
MNNYCIDELLPHSGKMLLLDKVLDSGDDWLTSQVSIKISSQFVINGAVPALVVIEYMAQTVAALAGIRSKNQSEAVRIGLLLGTRKFDSNVDSIPVGTNLEIHVKEMFIEENGLGVFKCQAQAPGIQVACNLNVYHPENIGDLVSE